MERGRTSGREKLGNQNKPHKAQEERAVAGDLDLASERVVDNGDEVVPRVPGDAQHVVAGVIGRGGDGNGEELPRF